MSISEEEEEEEYLHYEDNELGNVYHEYAPPLMPEAYAGERTPSSVKSIHPRWRKTPRSIEDFSESKTSISSCKDSDYQAWLKNYYEELYKKRSVQTYNEKQVDTSDLITKEKSKEILTSLFPSVKKDVWSHITKYWNPEDIRRHWPIRSKKNEYLFVPSIHPNLNLRSRYGRYLSQLNTAAAIPEDSYKKIVCSKYKNTIVGLRVNNLKLIKLMNCDTFCNIKWFDYLTKSSVMRNLCKFLRTQYYLEKVYLENANLERMQGIVLLCALSRNGGDIIKELHIWKMFGYGQCPVLINKLQRGENRKEKLTAAYFTKIHYLQILNNFSTLTHLSINYAYLANKRGDALLCLKCIRTGCLRELRILCLMDERPYLSNPELGVGGWPIGDGVWRRAAEWCPEMRVKFVFMNIPQYENIIVFLSKSIPVSSVYISSGMDLNFNTPWDIDSTLLEIRNWYSSTLDTLSLHLWYHRDLFDFIIKCKILEEFPNLVNFEFIGILEDIQTLEDFCCQLSQGTYNLKKLLLWVEERYPNPKKVELTRKRVTEIREKYKRIFQVIDLDADIRTYAM